MDDCFSLTWENDAQNEVVTYGTDESEILTDQTIERLDIDEQGVQDRDVYPFNGMSVGQTSSQENIPIYSIQSQVTEEVIIEKWEENCAEEVVIEKWDENCAQEIVVGYEKTSDEEGEIPIPTDQNEDTGSKPYPCDFCSRRFKKKTSLMSHMAAHQKTDMKYECEICGVRYIKNSDLLLHLKSHGNNEDSEPDINISKARHKKSFVCHYCGIGFSREKALLSHATIHEGNSPFACQQCNQTFWDFSSMEDHWKIKHSSIRNYDENFSIEANSRGTYSCTTCGISFSKLNNLKKHQRHHMEEELMNNSELGHMCSVCGESFTEALDLLAHAEVHARGFDYRCTICQEDFIDEQSCTDHVKEQHPNEENLFCVTCFKTFSNKNKLKKHQLSHHNRIFSCDLCMEEFPNRRTLMNHKQSSHSNSIASGQQYPCRECGKMFASRSSQQIHTRLHTGERPYGCKFCHKAFADGGTLRKHERIHTGEKPYACVICPKAFNQRVVLREHIRTHHSGPDPKYADGMTPYCCSVCSDMFISSQDLIVHIIHHCDTQTALARPPRIGPRKYVRRRGVKLSIDESYDMEDEDDEKELQKMHTGVTPHYEIEAYKRPTKRRKTSKEPFVTQFDTYSDEEVPPSTSIPESPSTHYALQNDAETKQESTSNGHVTSRAKMIHTEKKKNPITNYRFGGRRHKNDTITTTLSGEKIGSRTKNVNHQLVESERLRVTTLSEDLTAVQNLLSLNQPFTEDKNEIGETFFSDHVETPDVAVEETVETHDSTTELLQENRRRSPRKIKRSSIDKTFIFPSKRNRTVRRKIKANVVKQELQEDELHIKEEYENPNEYVIAETNPKEYPVKNFQSDPELEGHKTDLYQNISKRETVIDSSPLLELAEISMQHAQNLLKCEMCNSAFSDRSQLLAHVSIHI